MRTIIMIIFAIMIAGTAQAQVAVSRVNINDVLPPKTEISVDKMDFNKYTHVHVTGVSGWYVRKQKKGLKNFFNDQNSLIKYAPTRMINDHTLYLRSSASVQGTNYAITLVFKNSKGEEIYKIETQNKTLGEALSKFLL